MNIISYNEKHMVFMRYPGYVVMDAGIIIDEISRVGAATGVTSTELREYRERRDHRKSRHRHNGTRSPDYSADGDHPALF